jgi:hypothetical protein
MIHLLIVAQFIIYFLPNSALRPPVCISLPLLTL